MWGARGEAVTMISRWRRCSARTTAGGGAAASLIFATAFVPVAAAGAARSVSLITTRVPLDVHDSSGWSATTTDSGVRLTWRSAQPLPIGALPLQVRLAGTLLGTAREVGNVAVLDLRVLPAGFDPNRDLSALALWRGQRRLDDTSRLDHHYSDRTGAAEPTGDSESAPGRDPFAIEPQTDPGVPGHFASERRTYSLVGLRHSEYPARVEVVGEVTLPLGTTGRRPLVVILHGRHATCYRGGPQGDASGDWPCRVGWQPIPSHIGYRRVADLLASQGSIVVSISANGINGQDFASFDGGAAARSALVRHHLAVWSRWNRRGTDPWGGLVHDRVAMDRVVLIGHSRGGEGVARAAIDSDADDPWRIRGIVAIGPTAFGGQTPVHVPMAVLLPYCDGDVFDLQGQLYVDGARDLIDGGDPALHSAVLVFGANHNFFNAQWTPGLAAAPAEDDWSFSGSANDSTCGARGGHRLSARDQQQVGATYSAALVKFAIGQHPAMLPLLDGAARPPRSARAATVAVSAIGGNRVQLARLDPSQRPAASGEVRAAICIGWQPKTSIRCGADARDPHGATPHWVDASLPGVAAARLRWSGPGTVRVPFGRAVDLGAADRVDVRVAYGGGTRPSVFLLRLVDADGRAVFLPSAPSLTGRLPGRPSFAKVWARTLRGDLRDVRGVDLARVTSIDVVVATGRGEAWLFDVMAVLPGVRDVPERFVPRLTVCTVDVDEGDDPAQIVRVPLDVTGPVTDSAQYWVRITDGDFTTRLEVVTFAPGVTHRSVEVGFDGDSRPEGDRDLFVIAFARRNGTTGAYLGGAHIVDDEHWPRLSVEEAAASGTEADGVRFRFHLDSPLDFAVSEFGQFVTPENGNGEIDSDDVTASTWRRWTFSTPPDPPIAPSEAFAISGFEFEAGTTTRRVTYPFVADGHAEGPESFRLVFFDGIDANIDITGTVNDS